MKNEDSGSAMERHREPDAHGDIAAFEAKAVNFSLGRKHILRDFSISIPRGGVHALLGANGAGKSTLFRAALGFVIPQSGCLRVLNRPSSALGPGDRQRIGFVNEEHTLPGWASVAATIELQKKLYASRWDDNALDAILQSFDIIPTQKISQLSRGERAGLNLALALAQSPELLILDEPTLGLDVVARRRLLDAIIEMAATPDRTVIYCSHHIEEVERLADTLTILEQGRVKVQSDPDTFLSSIQCWIADIAFKPPPNETVPGLLAYRRIGDLHEYVVHEQGDRFRAFLDENGARSMQNIPLTLDRAVDAFLTANHAGPEYRKLPDA